MPRPRVYRTEAIVLKTTPLGEADSLVILYTPGLGKLRAVAKGVRRPTSRLVGHLEPLTCVELALARGQNLDIITQAQVLESFGPLKAHLTGASQGIYIAELVDGFGTEGSANPPLYSLLLDTLRFLSHSPGVELALRYFELKLLQLSGFMPELHRCVECRREPPPGQHRFSPDTGGVLCTSCSPPGCLILPLTLQAIKVLRFLRGAQLGGVARLRVSPTLGEELRSLLRATIRYWLEREVRSAAFLEHLRKEALQGSL
jgi:DNA repair protein RecO (recombination protein O)